MQFALDQTVLCKKQIDGSVIGILPDGNRVTWPDSDILKPDIHRRYAMAQGKRYRVIWTAPGMVAS